MVLTDDNFATIVSAVEEGRKIYSNIKKAVQFLLSSNLAEVVAIFLATILGLITGQDWNILAAVQILWINLVTDAFPALALGVEKAESDVMNKKPRKAKASFFDEGMGINVIFQGTVVGILTLVAYYVGEFVFHQHTLGMTMAFATLAFTELMHSLNVRSMDKSIFKIGLFSNKALVWAILGSVVLQVVVLTVPFIATLFDVEIMGPVQWAWVIGLSVSIIPIVEIQKAIYRATHVEKIM
jgi:Ca2+-transporting ATPase